MPLPSILRLKDQHPQSSLSYFKVLPHNDHLLDTGAWVSNPPFLRFEYFQSGKLFGSSQFYRFLVLVTDEDVSLHIGFPPSKKRSVESALRGSCPKVTLIDEGNPLEGFFGEGERVDAIAFRASSPFLPFNCDESLAEFQSVLVAFGAGRRDGVRGAFDVCFDYSPVDRERLKAALEREIRRLHGVEKPLIGGADLGMSMDAIVSALYGGKRGGRTPVVPPPRRQQPLMPADRERINAYAQRANARGVFRVRVRAAVSAGDPRTAHHCLSAVGGAMQSIRWYNSLTWAGKRGGLVKDIIEGRIGFAEPSFLMTERELAQVIVVPGQEMDYVWRVLERMPSRTAPPPLSLLGGGGAEDEGSD